MEAHLEALTYIYIKGITASNRFTYVGMEMDQFTCKSYICAINWSRQEADTDASLFY